MACKPAISITIAPASTNTRCCRAKEINFSNMLFYCVRIGLIVVAKFGIEQQRATCDHSLAGFQPFLDIAKVAPLHGEHYLAALQHPWCSLHEHEAVKSLGE